MILNCPVLVYQYLGLNVQPFLSIFMILFVYCFDFLSVINYIRFYSYEVMTFFFFFLFMSDAHHGINSSTQKYQSTQSNVALTSCRQDSGSPPF